MDDVPNEPMTVEIVATSSAGDDDMSIHIEWSWDAGQPRCGTADAPGAKYKKKATSGKITRPAEATVLTYRILFDVKDAEGNETYTWGTSGTKTYP